MDFTGYRVLMIYIMDTRCDTEEFAQYDRFWNYVFLENNESMEYRIWFCCVD